jgi:hypothetical protein
MIQLTLDQAQAVERNGTEPPLVMDPRTNETFVLVRKDVAKMGYAAGTIPRITILPGSRHDARRCRRSGLAFQ